MAEQSKTTRWSKTAVTDAGTSLLAEFAAGRILTITGAFGSSGGDSENLAELTELPDGRLHPLTIESVTKNDSSVTICIQVSSIGNPTPYKLDRIGIFATAGDLGEPEGLEDESKLLMVIEDTEDEKGRRGVTIPAESEQLYVFKLYAVLTVTNKERLEVSVSSAGIATVGAIKDEVDRHNKDENAHAGLMAEAIKGHNEDPEEHPYMTARIRAAEIALNGKETIIRAGDPTNETVGVKGQHYINLDTGAEFICNDRTDEGYIWGPVDTKTSMRELLAQTAETARQAKDVADGAAQAIAAVQNTISVIPSQSGSLTYNGGAQKPGWNNLALEMMDITYGEDKTPAAEFQGETDAGTYKAYVTPKEKYTWGDKSSDEKEILWTIQRATISATPSTSGPLPYTGEAQAPVWQNFNPEQLTKTETAQTNAGEHSTDFTPKPNFQWSGGDTSARTVKWTISKAANSFSVAPSGAQSVDVGDTVVIQVTSNSDAQITATADNPASVEVTVDAANKRVTIKGVGQGSANVTISSRGSANYTDASAVIGVNVRRKTPTLSISPAGAKTLTIGGSTQIAVTTDSDGAVSARSSAPGVATTSASGKNVTISGASAGSATITISVPQTAKYNAASVTVAVTVSKPTVSNSTWSDIKAISDAGTAASYFAVGDTKSITLNGKAGNFTFSNLRVDAFILGINHNANREGGNRIHWQIGKIGGKLVGLCDSGYNNEQTSAGYFHMNTSRTNAGGWNNSAMRKSLLGNSGSPSSPPANSLLAALPADLRSALKPVTKYTDNTGNNQNNASSVTATTDYLFLLAEFEVFGSRSYANSAEQNYQIQYAYYKAGNSRVAYKHSSTGDAVWWWLRSPYYDTNISFCIVATGGGSNFINASWSAAVLPGFTT